MGIFRGKWAVEGYGAYLVKTTAELVYITTERIINVVEEGFITDGASIPRAFWTFIGSPFTGLYRKPALIHDHFYATQKVTRKYADKLFLDAMKDEGVSWWKRHTMYRAVRGGAYFIWKRHAKRLKKERK